MSSPRPETPGMRRARLALPESALRNGGECACCHRLTKVEVVENGEDTNDPRGAAGLRAELICQPEEYGYCYGTPQSVCWDCLYEQGEEGHRKAIRAMAGRGGWLKPEQLGTKAIIELQSMVGISETHERAEAGWRLLDARNRESTMAAWYTLARKEHIKKAIAAWYKADCP